MKPGQTPPIATITPQNFLKLQQTHRPCKPCDGISYYRLDAFTIYSYEDRGDVVVIRFLDEFSHQYSLEMCKKLGMKFN